MVLRWPTSIPLQAIILRAERSGPRRADSRASSPGNQEPENTAPPLRGSEIAAPRLKG